MAGSYDIIIERQGPWTIVVFHGVAMHVREDLILEQVTTAVRQASVGRVAVDLTNCLRISSTVMSLFIRLHDIAACATDPRPLVVIGANPTIQRCLTAIGMGQIYVLADHRTALS
jgi:hypothetical protein